MNIPGKIKIKGRIWTIKLVKNLQKKKGILGLCDEEDHVILIDAGQSPKERAVTLLHEVLHALWPNSKMCANTEEFIIESVDSPLLDVLENNNLF